MKSSESLSVALWEIPYGPGNSTSNFRICLSKNLNSQLSIIISSDLEESFGPDGACVILWGWWMPRRLAPHMTQVRRRTGNTLCAPLTFLQRVLVSDGYSYRLRPSFTACRLPQGTTTSCPWLLSGPYRLEGATLADCLAANYDYEHSWGTPETCHGSTCNPLSRYQTPDLRFREWTPCQPSYRKGSRPWTNLKPAGGP